MGGVVESGGERSLIALANEVNWGDLVDKLRVVLMILLLSPLVPCTLDVP